MRADIHDGQGARNAPCNGPNTDARDQLSPDRHIRLAPHGRSIQKYMVKRRGLIGLSTRTLRSIAPSSTWAASYLRPSSAAFITTIAESSFQYTQGARWVSQSPAPDSGPLSVMKYRMPN